MKTRVQLPNGSLLRIEGGDAQQVADIITNQLTRNVPDRSAETNETALPVPSLNFAKEQVQANAEAHGEESALALPSTA